ncbi:tripartite tricarboxylate transporter TctB family protein [Streptomyces sp. PLAI1-29]|uniref:Tripartite tricarboxylate transporter TctB family protein n=1 Tax=Streptomyces zingiberis TaxID=2053010 RepID=A0ABX1BZW9_9ACTN|nr:tripartite tricarboxylate transporter TctB family protein [Streptomyces zingiberis]
MVTGVVLGVGTLTMDVPANVTSPGPQLFPTVIGAGCVVFAVLLGVDVLRRPEPEQIAAPADGLAGTGTAPFTAAAAPAVPVGDAETATSPSATANPDPDPDADDASTEDATETRVRSNRWAVTGLVGTIVAFIALLEPLGWLLSGTMLFWGVARSLGSRRPVFDLFLSLTVSSLVQLAFSAGLGLSLPPGVLAGVF